MMHIVTADYTAFGPQWEQDVPAIVLPAPSRYTTGDTIKLCETSGDALTGRYILSNVTAVAPLGNSLVSVQQAVFQRGTQ